MLFFFFNDTATTEIYTLSLHDALPISLACGKRSQAGGDGAESLASPVRPAKRALALHAPLRAPRRRHRSEEHTSELQSRQYLVCRLLLEKKKKTLTKPNYLILLSSVLP